MPTAAQPKALEDTVSKLEHSAALDRVADVLSKALAPLVPNGPVKDAASGTAIGHPVHPALVALPIGAWSSATVLDLVGGKGSRPAARRLVALGILSALPTAYTGASDWLDTMGAERRVGAAHALSNYSALALYLASWRARGKGRHARGVVLGLVGGGVLAVGGWLGGHLAYALGVGVDTTAFQGAPTDWTDVAAVTDVGDAPMCVDAAGVPVLLARLTGSGADGAGSAGGIVALADRCTHRGGPLHEGTIVDGCVECPWHGSRFRLADGMVAQGPATRPQPVYEVRVSEGRVQVRRADEPRDLRTNPVGV